MQAHTHIHTDHLLHFCVCAFDSWGIKYTHTHSHWPAAARMRSVFNSLSAVSPAVSGVVQLPLWGHTCHSRARSHARTLFYQRQSVKLIKTPRPSPLTKSRLQCECVRCVRLRVHERCDCKCLFQLFLSSYCWMFVPFGGATRFYASSRLVTLCLDATRKRASNLLAPAQRGRACTVARAWRTVSAGLSLPRPSLL